MARLALQEDLRLVFDPSMSNAQLSNNAFYNTDDDADAVQSIVDNAESEFWQRVDSAFRLDERRRYEVHEVDRSGHRAYRLRFSRVGTRYSEGPVEIDLEHDRVFPFDTAESPDALEVRTGMGDWEDITANSDDDWDLVDPSNGILLVEVDNVARTHGVDIRRNVDKVWIRAKYRYGARGGDVRVGGETTLAGSGTIISSGDSTPTTYSVDDASRLPPAPATLQIGESEYVSVSDVDEANDEITVDQRGKRLTSAADHDAGAVVHYAPLYVRTAVAKRAAIDMTQNDQYSEWLPDTDIPLDAPRKIDEWRNDWNDAVELLS
jgi:hypothetical protein